MLGFRTSDYIKNLNIWLINKLPLSLERIPDCKNLEEVGKPHVQKSNDKVTYIKLGDFNFDAVKYSLPTNIKRIDDKIPQIKNGFY